MLSSPVMAVIDGEVPRRLGTGFGQPKKPRARNEEAENLAIPKIEALLQEKILVSARALNRARHRSRAIR